MARRKQDLSESTIKELVNDVIETQDITAVAKKYKIDRRGVYYHLWKHGITNQFNEWQPVKRHLVTYMLGVYPRDQIHERLKVKEKVITDLLDM